MIAHLGHTRERPLLYDKTARRILVIDLEKFKFYYSIVKWGVLFGGFKGSDEWCSLFLMCVLQVCNEFT